MRVWLRAESVAAFATVYGAIGAISASGCHGQLAQPAEPTAANLGDESTRAAPDLARGGRLFDAWAVALAVDFVPDDPATPAHDGRGGPFGNGTLPDAAGRPMPNPGHDYRFVKLFGDDLRGAHSAFAACGTRSESVLVPELLNDGDDAVRWRERLRAGEDGIPAYGSVFSARDIDDVVAFLLAVRDGALPSPLALFRATPGDACGFTLLAGGDAATGQALHQAHCARCHGTDGKSIALGREQLSLGEFVRKRAPEAWYVILSGKVGTPMPGLISVLARDELQHSLVHLLHAYNDAETYPDH